MESDDTLATLCENDQLRQAKFNGKKCILKTNVTCMQEFTQSLLNKNCTTVGSRLSEPRLSVSENLDVR